MRRVSELMRMDGRIAILTGGAGHIGRAAGEALAESGAHVVVVDLDYDRCAERAVALEQHGHIPMMPLALDIAHPESAVEVVAKTLERFGRIDVLIHNAAYTGASGLSGYAVPFAEQTYAAWERALRVNLSAAFALAHAASGPLAESHNGSIIHVASIYGMSGPDLSLYEGTHMGNPAAYGASKGGLIQLTRYLATVLAPSVRVNCVSPGGIERGQPTEFQSRYCARTPLRRMGREEDLKGAIAFLASDAAAYITGHNLVVDGGFTAW